MRAVSVLTISLLAIDYVLVSPDFYGNFYFGKITIALYWLVQIALLGGPRLAYRYFKYARSRNTAERDAALPALLLGRGVEIEMVIRAMEAGTMRRLRPAGILTPRMDDLGQSIRGVPVLGLLSDIDTVVTDAEQRGEAFRRIVATPSGRPRVPWWRARSRRCSRSPSNSRSWRRTSRCPERWPMCATAAASCRSSPNSAPISSCTRPR